MGTLIQNIRGNDYVGAFASATDKFAFVGHYLSRKEEAMVAEALSVDCVRLSISGSGFIGVFIRANSNGIALSNIIEDSELESLKRQRLDLSIGVIDSNLNTIGNNILANDKVALVNPDYDNLTVRQIGDILGVEVIKTKVARFKTVGACNILTNKGFVINNRSEDAEKAMIDAKVRFDSLCTTANGGSLFIGLSTIANSNGVIAGGSTTGYELQRITEALGIE